MMRAEGSGAIWERTGYWGVETVTANIVSSRTIVEEKASLRLNNI